LISAPPSLVAASPYPPPAPAPAAVTDLDFLGVGIGVCGSVFINVGNNLVAMSAGGSGDGPRLSAIGWLVFSLGTLSVFAAFAFAAAAVVASLESLQFVVNLLFNYLVKRVEITWRMSLGTILILVGTAIVVANGPRQEELVTPLATLVDNWANPIWLIWLGAVLALALSAEYVHRRYLRGLEAGRELWRPELILPLSYSLASAPVGTQVQVMSKCFAGCVKIIAEGGDTAANLLSSWYLYVTVLLLIGSGAFWIIRLNRALVTYDPILIIPMLQSFFILSATLSGGFYFQEFKTLSTANAVFFASGILVELGGLALLASPSSAASRQEEDAACASSTVAPLQSADLFGVVADDPSSAQHGRRSFGSTPYVVEPRSAEGL